MLRTAAAMLPATFAITGYNLADTYFVAKIGEIPLAAMGFTFPVVMLLGCVFRGLAVGVMTPVAHALGAQKHEKAATLIGSGMMLTTLVALVISLAGVLTMMPTFRLLEAKPEVLPYIIDYMVVWYAGTMVSALLNTGNDLVIASGSPRSASLIMLGGLALNVVLDPMFIFGWGPIPAMGIKGAALATVLSQVFGLFGVLAVLRHKGLLERVAPGMERMFNYWGVVTRIAVPSIIGILLMPIGDMILIWITAKFGTTAVAATAAAGRLSGVAFTFPMALGIALTPMIAQNYGARLPARIADIQRFSFRTVLGFEFAVALLFFVFAPLAAPLFAPPDSPAVEAIMVEFLRIVAFGLGLNEIHRYSGFFYTGCNRPKTAAVLNAFRVLGLLIPFSLAALWLHSLTALFVARLLADVVGGVVGWRATTLLVRKLNRPAGAAA